MVSGKFFSGLGVKLARGRGFTEQDEANHAPIAVISYNYWTRRFARNPRRSGQDALRQWRAHRRSWELPRRALKASKRGGSTDFWIPLQSRPELNAWGNPLEEGKTYIANPTWWCMRLIARLAPGVTKTQAIAQLQPVFQSAAYIGLG